MQKELHAASLFLALVAQFHVLEAKKIDQLLTTN